MTEPTKRDYEVTDFIINRDADKSYAEYRKSLALIIAAYREELLVEDDCNIGADKAPRITLAQAQALVAGTGESAEPQSLACRIALENHPVLAIGYKWSIHSPERCGCESLHGPGNWWDHPSPEARPSREEEMRGAAYNHAEVFHQRLVAAQEAIEDFPSMVTALVQGYGIDVNEKQIDAWLRDALNRKAETRAALAQEGAREAT